MDRYVDNQFIVTNSKKLKHNYRSLVHLLSDEDKEKNKLIVYNGQSLALGFNGAQIGNAFNINGDNIFVNGKNEGSIKKYVNRSKYIFIKAYGMYDAIYKICKYGRFHNHLLIQYHSYKPYNITDQQLVNLNLDYEQLGLNNVTAVSNQKYQESRQIIFGINNLHTITHAYESTFPNKSYKFDLFRMCVSGLSPYNAYIYTNNALTALAEELDTLNVYEYDSSIHQNISESYCLLDVQVSPNLLNKLVKYIVERYDEVNAEQGLDNLVTRYLNTKTDANVTLAVHEAYILNLLKILIIFINNQHSCHMQLANSGMYECFNNDLINVHYDTIS